MFCNFCEKFENSKWPPFLARQKFFENWDKYSAEIPCWSKISSKSLYLARFLRYKHFVFCNFCENFENSKWPPFWARQKFFENWENYSGAVFRKGLSQVLGLSWLYFYTKLKPKTWLRPFMNTAPAEISCGSKISSKLLYLARLLRYKHFCVLQFLRKFRKFKMAAILGETKIF